MESARLTIEGKMVPQGEGVTRHLSLPEKGLTAEQIFAEMNKMDREVHQSDWKGGRVSGAVYRTSQLAAIVCATVSRTCIDLLDGGEDLTKIIVTAFERYCVSNPLHPDVFPAIRKMEAEVVAMCLRMYNNPTGAGTTTSGGTESIIMSVKAHRDWARATKGITEPEM